MTDPTKHGVSVFDGLVDAPSDLSAAIARVLNQHSAENVSNTPDYILGQFLDACLSAFDAATQQRETWYGRDARPTLIATAERAGEPVLRKFDHASEDRAKLALYAIGEAMGYGWAQAELGAEWERRHDCAPRGRMGVTVSDAPPAQAEPQHVSVSYELPAQAEPQPEAIPIAPVEVVRQALKELLESISECRMDQVTARFAKASVMARAVVDRYKDAT